MLARLRRLDAVDLRAAIDADFRGEGYARRRMTVEDVACEIDAEYAASAVYCDRLLQKQAATAKQIEALDRSLHGLGDAIKIGERQTGFLRKLAYETGLYRDPWLMKAEAEHFEAGETRVRAQNRHAELAREIADAERAARAALQTVVPAAEAALAARKRAGDTARAVDQERIDATNQHDLENERTPGHMPSGLDRDDENELDL